MFRLLNFRIRNTSGYTLVEALVYITILAVLSALFISLLFTMTRAYFEFRLARDVSSSASLSLERIVREIKQADSIDPSSVLGVHPGQLVLNTTLGGVETSMEFFLSDGTLMVKEGGGAAASTTTAGVSVDKLIFRQINTASSQSVRVELEVSASRGSQSKSANFYGAGVLRGSY